jgi:hypothetical protein
MTLLQQPAILGDAARRTPLASGLAFASGVEYSHSSTLRTMQEIFHVDPPAGYPWLGAAATASDLFDLFKQGAIR